MKTPLQKSVVAEFAIVNPSVDLLTPIASVVVIDFDRLEREVLKGSIADENVQKLLPFQNSLGEGENHVHIRNESAYTVETNSHYINEGETLCQRGAFTPRIPYVNRREVATCPGCLVKAKAIIVNHLLSLEGR